MAVGEAEGLVRLMYRVDPRLRRSVCLLEFQVEVELWIPHLQPARVVALQGLVHVAKKLEWGGALQQTHCHLEKLC